MYSHKATTRLGPPVATSKDGAGILGFGTVPTTPCCLTLHHYSCLGPTAYEYEFVIPSWDIQNMKLDDFVNSTKGHLYHTATMNSCGKRGRINQVYKSSQGLHSGILGWLLDEFIHLLAVGQET